MPRSSRLLLAALTVMPAVARAQTQPAPSPSPSQVTISGVMYGQYAYALRSGTAGHANNFDVTRAYLNFIGRFPDGVGGRVTADVYRNADGSLAYRLKYGFASWNPKGSALTYKFGMTQTPFVEYNENLWEYRVQGSDPSDRAGYLSSSDFGLAADGTWGGDRVHLTAGVYNGEFYSRTPGDQHKDAAARVSVRLAATDDPSRFGGLRATGFALVGEPNGGGTRQRFLGQLSYRSRRLTLAAFYLTTRDRADTGAVAQPTVAGRLVSVMGVFRIPNTKVALLGRVDSHDRNTGAADDRLSRVIAGAAYHVNQHLRVLADLDHTSYQGGSPTPALDAARSQLLFQLQLNF